LTRGCYSRRQIDRELSYYVGVGTPCLVHDARVKGSALAPKTRWGIACGMYREQVWFICPFTGSKWKSKSYSAYRLKSGVNPWQFLRLPQPESSRKSMAIPSDVNTSEDVVYLRDPKVDVEYKFVDCSPRFPPSHPGANLSDEERTQESGGSLHVRSHDGRLLSVDKEDGEMFYSNKVDNTKKK
jgi:hypothetical protein